MEMWPIKECLQYSRNLTGLKIDQLDGACGAITDFIVALKIEKEFQQLCTSGFHKARVLEGNCARLKLISDPRMQRLAAFSDFF